MTGDAAVWVLSNDALSDALQRVADGDSPTVVMAEIYANAATEQVPPPARGIWRMDRRYLTVSLDPTARLVYVYCFRYFEPRDSPLPLSHVHIPVERFWSVAP